MKFLFLSLFLTIISIVACEELNSPEHLNGRGLRGTFGENIDKSNENAHIFARDGGNFISRILRKLLGTTGYDFSSLMGGGGSGLSGLSGGNGYSSLLGGGGLSGLLGGGGFGTVTGTTSPPSTSTPTTGGTGKCSSVEIMVARGTTEPQSGSMIMAPIVKGIQQQVPSAQAYQVRYPASFDFATGPGIGAKDVVSHISGSSTQCFILIGYSQGAMVMTQAMKTLGSQGDRVRAVLLYGNPYRALPSVAEFKGRIKDFCVSDDPVCAAGGGQGIGGGHLSYGTSNMAKEGVAFAVSQVS